MIARTALLLAVAFASSLIPMACASRTPTSSSASSVKVGMVTDVGGLGDRSFNDGAYAGLLACKKSAGARVQVLQSKSAADYQPNLTVFATEGFAETFAIGFLMNRDLNEVAKRFPNSHFAIIDAVVDEPNVESVTFKEEDGSFLAGALAALVSKTRTIAFLGGVDIPLLRKFEAGYTAGAHEIDPKVKVLSKFVGSFEDVASGKELSDVLYSQGADIIFSAAGKSGLGPFEVAKDRPNSYVIGVDSNQDALLPGKVLTSMVKHVDNAVQRVCTDAVAHRSLSGHLVLGLRQNGVGLTDFQYTRDLIGAANIARVNRIREAIIAGKIVPPATRDELAKFKPVPIP
jgi:basic membrane protein A and related proteins